MKVITIFVSMEVVFLKRDSDYFGITLDEKYFNYPYGIIKILNEQYTSYFTLKLIGILIVFIFLSILFL